MTSRGQNDREPSATLFAILGLLAIRPLTPYDLTKHFDRSLKPFLPRARSKLFEGPKRLVELGYARANTDRNGGRTRTLYTITPKGRRALAAWLAEPGAGPEVEFTALMKFFFAEHGTKRDAIANLEAAHAWASDKLAHHVEVGTLYRDGTGPFQEREAILAVTGTFLAEFAIMVERWARWALEVVATWPDDPSKAKAEPDRMTHLVKQLQKALTESKRRS